MSAFAQEVKPMTDCAKVAGYFVALVDESAGDALTNLKLQKLLYYAQGFHLASFGAPLFGEQIEAWEHGPVVPELYRSLKQHGAEPIPVDPDFNPEELDLDVRLLLEDIYSVYGQFSASKLRNMTHGEPPWKQTPRGKVISHAAMAAYFKTQLIVDSSATN